MNLQLQPITFDMYLWYIKNDNKNNITSDKNNTILMVMNWNVNL